MNALFAIIVWFMGLFSPQVQVSSDTGVISGQTSSEDLMGIHIVNPRTVVALEDTHFRPN